MNSKTKNQIMSLLPGLIHTGVKPWRISIGRTVRSVRLQIPNLGHLDLTSIAFSGVAADSLKSATITQSSHQRADLNPRSPLNGKPLQTVREENPFWQIEFKEPTPVGGLDLIPRLGILGTRAHPLQVVVTQDDGSTVTVDNSGRDQNLIRLGRFVQTVADLMEAFDSLPKAIADTVEAARLEIQDDADRLIAAVQAWIDGTLSDDTAPQIGTHPLLGSLTKVNDILTGKHLGTIIAATARVLDPLLSRPDTAPVSEPTALEKEALGTVFAARFIAKKSVTSNYITENERFLRTREDIEFIEARVNALYVRVTNDETILPILFRAHAMKGAELKMNADKYVKSLKSIADTMGGIGYPTALCYGTYLGAVRTGDFIPHDDDVDMAMIVKSTSDDELEAELNDIIARLAEIGVKAQMQQNFLFLKVWAPDGGKMSDLFPIIQKDADTVRMFMEQLKIRDVPSRAVLPFGTMNFRGEDFLVPANAEEFFTERYGPTWPTPMRRVGAVVIEA